jgi:hypothetical protein
VIQEEKAPKVASEATEITSEEELPSEVATGAPIEEAKAPEITPEAPKAPTEASGKAEAGKQSCDVGKVTKAAHTTTKVNDVEVEINEARRSRSTAKIAETKVAAAEGLWHAEVTAAAQIAETPIGETAKVAVVVSKEAEAPVEVSIAPAVVKNSSTPAQEQAEAFPDPRQ